MYVCPRLKKGDHTLYRGLSARDHQSRKAVRRAHVNCRSLTEKDLDDGFPASSRRKHKCGLAGLGCDIWIDTRID